MSLNKSDCSARFWVIVPAAGVGARMKAERPKQYLLLGNKTILEHTLARLLQIPDLAGLLVAISPADQYWNTLSLSRDTRITHVAGGDERSHSVLNALNALVNCASDNDWVLVHDAARPCVTLASIARLSDALAEHTVGGILAVPVSDTVKKTNTANDILGTLDRSELWQAQTPQMFRFGILRRALVQALASDAQVTDEASALELSGYVPRIVEGRSDNIKITRPEDLAIAEVILLQQDHQPQIQENPL